MRMDGLRGAAALVWLRFILLAPLALLGGSPAGAQALSGEISNAERGVSFTVPNGWNGQQGKAGP